MSDARSPGFELHLPSHAYLPGQNERHPENAFDSIRATAVLGESTEQLARCDAFQLGLYYLELGYCWEAHEVMEPVWMALPEDSIERRFVQALIQLANGRLKLRMGRHKAALRLVGIVRALIPSDVSGFVMTLEVRTVRGWIDALESEIQEAREN